MQEQTSKIPPELETGDPFEFFEKQTFALHGRLSLPVEFVPEAIHILKGAFGEQWLREQVALIRPAPVLPQKFHPLGIAFGLGEAGVVQLLELAVYIKKLIRVPKLDVVLKEMKVGYFHSLLQLAYAYRFQKAGASDLEFEPDAEGGRKADIFFALDGRPQLIECYTPHTRYQNTSRELEHSVDAIFRAITSGMRRICIRLKRPINALDRKRIERITVSAIGRMGDAPKMEVEDDLVLVSIEAITEEAGRNDFPEPGQPGPMKLYGDADWGINQQLAYPDEIPALRLGQGARKPLSRIFVWQAPAEKTKQTFGDRLEELEKKIGAKLPQTRRNDEPGRILVVSLQEAHEEDEESTALLQEIHSRLVKKHKRMAAVILTDHVWTVENRHHFIGRLLPGGEGYSLSEATFARMTLQEESEDILQDWR